MKKLALAGAMALALFSIPAHATCTFVEKASGVDAAMVERLQAVCDRLDTLIAGGSGAGTGDVNIKNVNGATVAVGHGTAATAQRVELPTDGTGQVAATQGTASNLKVEPAGNVAAGAADAGNPIKAGGVYNTALPTYTAGNRADVQTDSTGSLRARLALGTTTGADGFSNTLGYALSPASNSSTVLTSIAAHAFNGATWDRQFTCTSQASATITAGSTTQIVALSGSTNIRVCSYQVGIATTGTFKFVSGTGTNCGTGTADITPATNLIAGNVAAVSAGNNSVFRAGASNALCVAAVTGNVQAFVSYAQF